MALRSEPDASLGAVKPDGHGSTETAVLLAEKPSSHEAAKPDHIDVDVSASQGDKAP
jgi:hypothetical protein